MAFQKDYTITIYGKTVIFEKAYIAIDSINGSKEKMGLIVNVYDNYNRFNKIDTFNHFFTPSVEDNADNFYKQGYTSLKTKPELENAIDVLEPGQGS